MSSDVAVNKPVNSFVGVSIGAPVGVPVGAAVNLALEINVKTVMASAMIIHGVALLAAAFHENS